MGFRFFPGPHPPHGLPIVFFSTDMEISVDARETAVMQQNANGNADDRTILVEKVLSYSDLTNTVVSSGRIVMPRLPVRWGVGLPSTDRQ